MGGGGIFDSNTQSKQRGDLNDKPAEKSFRYQIKVIKTQSVFFIYSRDHEWDSINKI